MRSMSLNAELGQFLGDIEEWSPTTTVGSTSKTTSIGGSINAAGASSGGGISWSASTTNSTEDVEVFVGGNTTNSDGVNGSDWVSWDVTFAKCQANNLGTKIKHPAAAAQGLWKEPMAIITVNDDLNEGTKFTLIPQFKIEHCRCGSGSCPIRKSSTYYPWGTAGRTFQVVAPESCE